jgi:hypothetical protein
MGISRCLAIVGIVIVSTFCAVNAALASHGKIGLWNITITMVGNMPGMPDMSKLPPEAAAQMKAMGMSMGSNAIRVQHCMTAQEVASDVPPANSNRNQSCTTSNIVHTGQTMSADMKCTGDFQGTGHIEITYDSDAHYAGEMKMNGIANGHPMTQDQKMEGSWISASCGGVDH